MTKVVLIILSLLYPILVYQGLHLFSFKEMSVVLLVVIAIRFLVSSDKKSISSLSTFAITSVLLLFSAFTNMGVGVLLYPVIVNSILAITFAYSLFNSPTVIEKIARLQTPKLPEYAISYTRTVTKVWIAFFIVNGLISSYTVFFSDIETWTLYNGFIAYVLMGFLFAIEFLIRKRVQKRNDD